MIPEFFSSLDYEDIDTIIKVIGTILGGFFFAYIQTKKLPSKKTDLRADYELGKNFLLDNKWRDFPDLLLEKAYLAFSGRHLDASILKYFLQLQDVSNKLYKFNQGRDYLDIKREYNEKIINISIKKPFTNKIRYIINQAMAFMLYFFFAFISMIVPVLFWSKLFEKSGFLGIFALVMWFLFFFIIGFFFLKTTRKLTLAKKLHILLNKDKLNNLTSLTL